MIDYSQILIRHYPNAQWSLNGDTYEGLTWLDATPKPTQAELDALWIPTQAAHAATQYRRDRVYPPIGDQLDDLFRQGAFSPEMAAQLQAVKDAHPKGVR